MTNTNHAEQPASETMSVEDALRELRECAEFIRNEKAYECATRSLDALTDLEARVRGEERERNLKAVEEVLVGNRGAFHLFNAVKDAVEAAARPPVKHGG